ncbi:hypothetical protein D3C87_1545410 [compost metagenome]
MRTSTGSMSVMKIIQKKPMRKGKRKNTIAKADRKEMTILPMAMASATTKLLNSSRSRLTPTTLSTPPTMASV